MGTDRSSLYHKAFSRGYIKGPLEGRHGTFRLSGIFHVGGEIFSCSPVRQTTGRIGNHCDGGYRWDATGQYNESAHTNNRQRFSFPKNNNAIQKTHHTNEG